MPVAVETAGKPGILPDTNGIPDGSVQVKVIGKFEVYASKVVAIVGALVVFPLETTVDDVRQSAQVPYRTDQIRVSLVATATESILHQSATGGKFATRYLGKILLVPSVVTADTVISISLQGQ